jgi:uncharacterized protein
MKTLCLMAKAPVLGAVKTRLARGSSGAEAVAAYRTMLRLAVRRLSVPRAWRLVLVVAPDAAVLSPSLPASPSRIVQGRGDLGDRMQRVFDRFTAQGPVVIIGADIPGITRGDVAAAFHALGGHDAVVGPSDDGGYWLIGAGARRRIAPFAQVRWSSAFALQDTLAGMRGFRVARLRVLADVDTTQDWRAWTRLPPSARFRGN